MIQISGNYCLKLLEYFHPQKYILLAPPTYLYLYTFRLYFIMKLFRFDSRNFIQVYGPPLYLIRINAVNTNMFGILNKKK